MKVFAAVALSAVVLSSVAEATAESSVHLRVHGLNEKVARWGQCKWIDHTAPCDAGLQCAISNDYYGQCVQTAVGQWEQCGGKGWTGSCTNPSNKCVKTNDYYSQCRPSKHHHHHHKKAEVQVQKVARWGQCKWIDHTAPCDAGLQCAISNDYYGQCVQTAVGQWEQCGGKGWTGSCTNPSNKCVKTNDYYSQCRPSKHHHHHKATEAAVAKVARWGQCKWIDHTAPCDAGLQCAISNDYYGQCVQTAVGQWEQCGGKGWTGSCTNPSNKCVKTNDYYSQCRPN